MIGTTNRAVRRAVLSIARKNGKALALDTKIPTPDGFTTMGEIEVGDTVFDENGTPCRVTFATPIQRDRNCYRVRFADGAEVVADADHQWTVNSHKHKRRITLTTAQMLGSVRQDREDIRSYNYSVDTAGPIHCKPAELPVPPYTLGVWLGDGSSYGARVACSDADAEIMEHVAADGIPVWRREQGGGRPPVWGLTDRVKDRTKDCVSSCLRKMGLLQNKHIPINYQRASIDQRMALLQGLMDTDGCCSTAGQCKIELVDEALARDTLQLIRGLGFKASLREAPAMLYEKHCGTRYRIQFWPSSDRPVFRLERKSERQKDPVEGKTRNSRNSIVSIEPVESVPVRCITVDSASSLYLFGESFTPTHNTALIAGLMLCHLVGPEAVPNGEIYSAANDREQAAQVYKVAAQIVRADPELNLMLKCIDSTKTIACYSNGSFYRALSAESGTKHGLNPTFIVYDELSQAKSRELLDVLQTSMGAREEPLLVVISTQSNDPQHVLSVMIDDGLNSGDETIVCHLYEIPEEDDVFDEDNWAKANPAIDDFRSRIDMRSVAEKAARTPSDEPMFRNLYCNQRVAPTSSVLTRKEWGACAGDALIRPGDSIYLGLDMSSVNDLTALVGVSDGPTSKVLPFMWKPRMYLDEHSDRDFGSGNKRYTEWFNQGFLLATETRTIDPEAIARHVASLCATYKVLGLAYDLWRIKDVLNVFDRIGLEAWHDTGSEEERKTRTGLRLVSWGQGFRDMGPAVTALEREVQDRTLVHPSNPVLTWAVGNAMALTDAAGNKKLDKEASRFRIDPAVAMAMAVGLKSRDRKVPPKEVQFF